MIFFFLDWCIISGNLFNTLVVSLIMGDAVA